MTPENLTLGAFYSLLLAPEDTSSLEDKAHEGREHVREHGSLATWTFLGDMILG